VRAQANEEDVKTICRFADVETAVPVVARRPNSPRQKETWHVTKTRLIPFLSLGCALLAAQGVPSTAFGQAAQSTPPQSAPGAMVAWTAELVATVESVDQQSREVLLRGPGGGLVTVTAGPEVRNLARVQAGDRVVVRYIEALAASLAKPDESGGPSVQMQADIARHAPPGSRPTGTVGEQIRATVRIEAVDRAKNTVTFTGPTGAVRTVAVREPDAQRFLQTLNAGDRVDLVYTESLAVAVEPMTRP
jgi:hypothetical protein